MAIIYKIHYVNVPVGGDEAADGMVKAYIGYSLSEDPNYWGSMFPMGLKRIRDDHDRVGLPIERRREILWRGEPDATLTPREYALITEHRTNIPAYGYNRMPMLEGVNIPRRFNWDPPGSGVRIQKTTDCRLRDVHHSHPRRTLVVVRQFTDPLPNDVTRLENLYLW